MDRKSVVLEIGCGTGEFTQRIAPHVHELWATDLSPGLLERAQQRIRMVCPQAHVTYAVQDAMELHLPDDHFDAVFGCSMLHHVNPSLALRETCRVLRPGGWCVFSEPNMLNPQIALQKNIPFLKRRAGDSPDETAFFRWELNRLLVVAGFQNSCVRNFDFLHPGTPATMVPAMARLGSILEKCPLVRSLSGSLILCAQKPSHAKHRETAH